MDVIPTHVGGLPAKFHPRPFSISEAQMSATTSKQPVRNNPTPIVEQGQQFYLDFDFMGASTEDYTRPDKEKDQVVLSYDGYNSYLLAVDEVSKYVWVFLTKSKEPPLDLITSFLNRFGHEKGDFLRTDQGSELARSDAFRQTALTRHFELEIMPSYVVEPIGADSPSQNGAVFPFHYVSRLQQKELPP